MPVRDPIDRWRLSDDANESDREQFQAARDKPKDRRGNKERARLLQSLWKRGAIVTQPALT